MEFQKFPSLEDWTNKKAREGFLARLSHPTVHNGVYLVVQEKVDGANIQLLFQAGRPMRVGRRTAWLKEGDHFFDIWTTLQRYKDDLDHIQAHVDKTAKTWRLYGEIYGPKVQRRIPYGSQSHEPSGRSRICFFDLCIYDQGCTRNQWFVTPQELEDHLCDAGVLHLMVPNLYMIMDAPGLEDLMLYHKTHPFQSKIALGSPAEGVVIRPYNRNLDVNVRGVRQRTMLKYRNPEFREMSNARLPKPDLTPLQQAYLQYFNANRACSVVSKLGPPTKATIGKVYIPELKRDALEDFCKDHPEVTPEGLVLTPEERDKLARTKIPNLFDLFLDHVVE
jgi:hypothetical protein